MASTALGVKYNATSAGTVDFVYSSTVQGYSNPSGTSPAMVDGRTYRYRAESVDLTQWEWGSGVYTAASQTIARTTIQLSSTGAKVSFTLAPIVGVVVFPSDLALFDNLAVTGTSSTYAANQAGINLERSNSGAAMSDTLPGTGTAVLPANTVVTVTNADASALLVISAASGAVIKNATIFNGFLYLGPGQSVQIQSDGSNYWAIGAPVRAKLAANTTIFVATTGNDSTSHGTTSGSAFLTTNRAWAFAQSMLDLNGFALTIQHATGNYASTIVLQGPMIGQNGPASVLVQGDLVTPANVTLPGTGSAVSVTVNMGAQCQIQGFTISSTSSQGLYVGDCSVVNFQTNTCGATSGSFMAAALRSVIRIIGSYTISGSQGVHWNANGGTIGIEAASVTVTLTGTPAFATCFAFAQNLGLIFFDFGCTFSGSGTGPRWAANNNGVLTTGGSTLPGSVGGTATNGGVFN